MSTAPLTLRPYQREAVAAAVAHLRRDGSPACLVLPTGAGKSLVIAELCRIARGSVLVLAHVKELCQQNYDKFRRAAPAQASEAGLYSAGLKARDIGRKITFGSVQSVARHLDHLERNFSLLVIDECHRLSGAARAQYSRVVEELRAHNPKLFVLGLTATPYRLGMGWCYQRRMAGPCGGALVPTDDSTRPFVWCLYEVSLRHLLQQGHLTPPRVLDAPIASYDFTALEPADDDPERINSLLVRHGRVTRSIAGQIVALTIEQGRRGVMIFARRLASGRRPLELETSAHVQALWHLMPRPDFIVARAQNLKGRAKCFTVTGPR